MLFNSGKFVEACLAYREGLKLDPSNPVLYCNRAADQNLASGSGMSMIAMRHLKSKLITSRHFCGMLPPVLGRLAKFVQDYEILRKVISGEADVAKALLYVVLAQNTSRGEVSTFKLGGEVEEVTVSAQFQAVISTPEFSSDGDSCKRKWIIGVLIEEGFENRDTFCGNTRHLYAISPIFRVLPPSGKEKNFIYSYLHPSVNSYDPHPKPVGLAFGGNIGNDRIHIDEDFDRFIIQHHAYDKTYPHGSLTPSEFHAC